MVSFCVSGLPPLTGDAARFKPVLADVAAIYATWISWRATAIRGISKEFLLTVGFNNVYSMLPEVNELLDFTAHHICKHSGSLALRDLVRGRLTEDALRRPDGAQGDAGQPAQLLPA